MKKLLLLVIILMSIVSCGKPEAQKEFEKLVNILQKGDAKELKTIDINFDKKEAFSRIFLTGYKKLTYKVNKTVVKGDVATINVTMKSPDLSVYVEEYMQQLFSIAFVASNMTKQESDELMEKTSANFFETKLKSKDLKYLEKTVDVVYKKNGKKWEIDDKNPTNKEYQNMMLFGMFDFFEGLSNIGNEK